MNRRTFFRSLLAIALRAAWAQFSGVTPNDPVAVAIATLAFGPPSTLRQASATAINPVTVVRYE